MSHSFQRRLDDLHRRLRRVAWTFGLCRTAAVAIGLFVFIGVLDTVIRFDPPIFRVGLLATWALAVFGVAWESLYRPLSRLPGRSRLAELVERRFDSLHGELTAAVEFAESEKGDEKGVRDSQALRDAVIAAAEKNSSETDFGEIVDRSTARRAAVHAGIAGAILVTLAVVFPRRLADRGDPVLRAVLGRGFLSERGEGRRRPRRPAGAATCRPGRHPSQGASLRREND